MVPQMAIRSPLLLLIMTMKMKMMMVVVVMVIQKPFPTKQRPLECISSLSYDFLYSYFIEQLHT